MSEKAPRNHLRIAAQALVDEIALQVLESESIVREPLGQQMLLLHSRSFEVLNQSGYGKRTRELLQKNQAYHNRMFLQGLDPLIQRTLEETVLDPDIPSTKPDILETAKELPDPYRDLLGWFFALNDRVQEERITKAREVYDKLVSGELSEDELFQAGNELLELLRGGTPDMESKEEEQKS